MSLRELFFRPKRRILGTHFVPSPALHGRRIDTLTHRIRSGGPPANLNTIVINGANSHPLASNSPMSIPRFLVSDLTDSGELELSAAESKHASHVLRLEVGDPVALFDGRGGEAAGRVARTGKRSTAVLIERRTDSCRELAIELELFVALPKGDRQKTLVEGLTQLGVTKLTPLMPQRGVAQPTGNAILRLQRVVVEASKQCRRNHLMEIGEPRTLADLAAGGTTAATCAFAHPMASHITPYDLPSPAQGRLRLAVGPEGGFTDEEVAQLDRSGWLRLWLGPRILRVEMAAVAMASCVALAPWARSPESTD